MNWLVKQILKFIGTQKFLSAQLDITNACNLSCVHCYQPNHCGSELPFSKWQNILDQYSKLAKKLALKPCFSLSGGEPTLSPLFLPILDEIHRRWPEAGITIITNGTAFSEKIVSKITFHSAAVQISLDGPDAERHDMIRGAGCFNRIMAAYSALQNAGISPAFQAVLSYRTAPWINEFFQTAGNLKVSAMNFARFVPQGRGELLINSGNDRPLVGLELRDAYAAILAASTKTGINTSTNKPLYVLLSPELGANGKSGFQGLVIDYQGNLKVSSRVDFRLGNIFETGLEELFLKHPIMRDLRRGEIEVCGACQFYDSCGGDRNASFAAYGSFLKKDPGCWLLPNGPTSI